MIPQSLTALFLTLLLFTGCAGTQSGRVSTHDRLSRATALLAGEHTVDFSAAVRLCAAALAESPEPIDTLQQIRDIFHAQALESQHAGAYSREAMCYLTYIEHFDSEDVAFCVRLAHAYSRSGNRLGALYFATKAYNLTPEDKSVIELMQSLNPL